MPRISIEGAVGIAMGVLLLILDKMGIGGLPVYMVLFGVAAVLCFDSVIRSEWATRDRDKQAKRRLGGGAIVCVVFAVLGIWIFRFHVLPQDKHVAEKSEPQKPELSQESPNVGIQPAAPTNEKNSPAILTAQKPRGKPIKPPTLSDLFKKDFPGTVSVNGKGFDLQDLSGQPGAHVDWRVLMDFPSKNEFIAFYIPPVRDEVPVCLALIDRIRPIINGLSQNFDASGGPPGESTSLRDLTFSGRVFIYHEWPLSNKQKADIVEAYSAKGMDVQFRGVDYLGQEQFNSVKHHVPKKTISAPSISTSGDHSPAIGSVTQGPGSIAQIGGSGNSATVINATHPIPNISWTLEDRTDVREGHPVTFVKIKLDGLFDNPRFVVICDRPCKGVSLGVLGYSQQCLGSIPGAPNFGLIYPIAPNPFPALVEAVFGVASEDSVPVKVLGVKALKLTQDNGCTP